MRSLVFAVVIFAGILAHSSAAPQITRGDLTWLENILRGIGSQNSTIRFGNNTLIVSGISTASANVNPSPVEPHRPDRTDGPHRHNNPWGNYPGYGYGGYWRMDGEIVEEPENSNSYDSDDFAFDLNEDESVEDIIEEDESDEDHSFSDTSSDAEDEDVNEAQDEELDQEEEAVDKELDDTESELPAEKTN